MRYTGPTAAVQAIVDARDDQHCLRCGQPGNDYQHRIGRGMGGSRRPEVNGPAAIVTLCRACHSWCEREERGEAFATGWAVRRNGIDLPSEVPLVDLQGRLFFLTEEGEIKPTTLGGLWPEQPETIERPW